MRIYIVGGIMAGAGAFTALALNALGLAPLWSVLCSMPVGMVIMFMYDYDGSLID